MDAWNRFDIDCSPKTEQKHNESIYIETKWICYLGSLMSMYSDA